jgi:radical SAM-linked protein
VGTVATTPLPASLANGTSGGGVAGGGTAGEWLGAVRSALDLDVPAAPAVQRLRLRYRKVGAARFIGTREIGTVLLRAARRAGLPLAFSRGHHPLPRISFGPALPLGFSSDDEYLDVELTEVLAADGAVERLAAELPEGLEPVAAVDVPLSAPSIDPAIRAFVYEVDASPLDVPPSPDEVAAAVARFEAAAQFPVRKRSRAGERLVDARRVVHALAHVGPRRVRLEVAVEREGTLKPELVVGELLGIPHAERPILHVHKVATRFHDPAVAVAGTA